MHPIKLLAIFAENKTGYLARVTALLAEANINIRWVSIAGTDKFGVIKLLVNDADLAYGQLKHSGVPVSLVNALAISVDDKPGGLNTVARCLAEAGINVENASGFPSQGRAILFIEAGNLARAEEALREKGLRLLTPKDLLET